MTNSDAEFHFPVLGFTPDGDIWSFADLNALTSCGPHALKNNLHAGMELVDAGGHRWLVRSVRRIGRAKPLLIWLLLYFVSPPQSRIELELEEMPPAPLEEMKRRAYVYIEAYPDIFPDDDETAETIEQVRTAKSTAEFPNLGTISMDF